MSREAAAEALALEVGAAVHAAAALQVRMDGAMAYAAAASSGPDAFAITREEERVAAEKERAAAALEFKKSEQARFSALDREQKKKGSRSAYGAAVIREQARNATVAATRETAGLLPFKNVGYAYDEKQELKRALEQTQVARADARDVRCENHAMINC